jgi:hypothetical protein
MVLLVLKVSKAQLVVQDQLELLVLKVSKVLLDPVVPQVH